MLLCNELIMVEESPHNYATDSNILMLPWCSCWCQCCDTAQALVFLLVSIYCDTAQVLVFLLVSIYCDTAQVLVC